MNELAAEHPRWGYRTIATLLVGEGWKVNIKRSVDSGGWREIEFPGGCPREPGSELSGVRSNLMEASGKASQPHLGDGLHTRDHAPGPTLPDLQRGRRVHPGRPRLSDRQIDRHRAVIEELAPVFEAMESRRSFARTTVASSLRGRSRTGSRSAGSPTRTSRKVSRSKTASSSATTARGGER